MADLYGDRSGGREGAETTRQLKVHTVLRRDFRVISAETRL
ncbi:hypothetical protein [Sphingobium yanoikuyae]|nr:hypothetical protein [Sphingobium yanoikuyae]